MAIEFGTQLFASVNSLEPGQLIEFGYNGTTRWGVVVTPEWKDNCDCYVFDSKEDNCKIPLHPYLLVSKIGL